MNFFRKNKGQSKQGNGMAGSNQSVMVDDSRGLFDDNPILNVGEGLTGGRKEVPVT